MLAALAILALQPIPNTLTLYRGAHHGSPRYWDVQDTYLDAADPNANFGGSYTLLGGKGRTILVRFGDLNRMVGPSRKVAQATLTLHLSGGAPDGLRSAGRL